MQKKNFRGTARAIVAAALLAAICAAALLPPYDAARRLDRGLGTGFFTSLYDRISGIGEDSEKLVSVSVQDSPYFRITSENPVRVSPGGRAEFTYELADGCRINGLSEGFTLEEGRITAENVKFPSTCVADAGPVPVRSVEIETADFAGGSGNGSLSASSSVSGSCPDGTPVTFTALPAEDYEFVCFTSDLPAASGGSVLSEEPVFTCTVRSDMKIYANYRKTRVSLFVSGAEGITLDPPDFPIKTDVGGTLSVSVSVAEGYVIESVSAGTIDNGILTVGPMTSDTEAVFSVRKLSRYTVSALSSDPGMGSAEIAGGNGAKWEGSEITVSASPKNKYYVFSGFTLGTPLSEGSEPVCSSAVYSFVLESDTVVYANFRPKEGAEEPEYGDPTEKYTAPAGKWLLFYHPNGGINTETGDGSYLSKSFSNKSYYFPNAIWGSTAFKRLGYVLTGYNTEPDGSGTYYAPGWNVHMPENRMINLYCQWAEACPDSDFKYKVSGSSVTLTGYTGNASFLVVPETVGGKKVTALAAGFLSGNSSVEKLLISANVRTLSKGSVKDCPNLREIYFSDAVTSVTDGWYTGCPQMSTLYVMAYHAPRYCGKYQGSVAIKAEALQYAALTGQRKLVLAGGSNVVFGVDSPSLTQMLRAGGQEFFVINLGINAVDSINFYLEVASHFLSPGDVLVHCPEVSQPTQYGKTDFVTNHWSYFESAYEVFSLVDIRHYSSVFSTFRDFNKARTSTASYESISPNVNRNGDYTVSRPGISSGFSSTAASHDKSGYGPYGYENTMPYINNAGYREEYNRAMGLCKDTGATVLLSFGVVYGHMLTRASQIPGGPAQTEYEQACAEAYGLTRISSVKDYIFESKYMYDSSYHLNAKGVPIRTRRLADDLLAYFDSENSN